MASDCSTNDHQVKIPIRLQKTTNITKIKGWRNKRFDCEGEEIRSETRVDNREALTLRNIDELTIVNENEASTSSASSSCCSKAVGQTFKVGRNPELLDSLVKKIGDPMDNAFGNNISRTGPTSFKFQQSDCMAMDTLDNSDFSSLLVNNAQTTKINLTSSDIPEKIKGCVFENPAFVSESLDEFLSGEPAMIKLNNRSSKLSMDITYSLEVEDKSAMSVKNGKANGKEPMWNLVELLNDYENRPRTLAEKRRMLESCNIPNKRARRSGLKKQFDSRLKRGDNFQRNNITDMRRLLRSSFITEDSECTRKEINYSDDINDSMIDDRDESVAPDVNVTKMSSSKDKLRHPHLKPYARCEPRASTNVRRRGKPNLQKIREKLQNEKRLETPLYVQSLRRRILFEFMPLLKKEEVVTASMRSPDIRKRVGMVLFAGIGRCLYQEQFENIEMVRRDNCIIDKDFVHFATSTVLDRQKPNRITRLLVPVLTTELLTFMSKYHIIREHYKNFLINKYKINMPFAISSSDSVNVAATKRFSNSSTECSHADNIASPPQNKNSVSHAQKSNSPVSNKRLNDMIVEESSRDKEDTNAITLEQDTSIPVDDKESRIVAKTEGSKTSPTSDINSETQASKKRRLFLEKTTKKLHYELRRLNHDLIYVDDTNSKDVSDILMRHNVMSNKLARVESEFHQTIMKANEDLVMVSSFGERSRRHKKPSKKLEDTVFSDGFGLINKRQHKKSEKVISPDVCREAKTSVSKKENLLPRVIQPDPQKPHSDAKPKFPEDFVNKTNLERTVKDYSQKETVIVQTARSILKKNTNMTCYDNNKLTKSKNTSKDVPNNLTGRIKKSLKSFNKVPVVRLTRLTNVNSSQIWCVKHNMFRCSCLDFRSQPQIKTFFPAVEKSDFINGLKSLTKQDGIDFYRFGSTRFNGEGVMLTKDDGPGTMVPRIENVMSLQNDDFFKDFVHDDDSSPTGPQNKFTAVQQFVTPEFMKPLAPHGPSTVSKHIIKPKIRNTFFHQNYRFFCVLVTHSFSYLKFLDSVDRIALSETCSTIDPNVGVILAHGGILNMIRESQNKQVCVFQQLTKKDFDHKKFNNLQFGIYAAGRNMVHFGPYTMNEQHQLQAFKVAQETASEAKLIPFVSPEFINKYVGVKFVVGYWWRVLRGRTIDANRAALEAINTKRLLPPFRINGSLLAAGHVELAPKPPSPGLLNCNKKTDKIFCSNFINIGDPFNGTVAAIRNFAMCNNDEEGVEASDTSRLFKTNKKCPVLNMKKWTVTYPDQNGLSVDIPVSNDMYLGDPEVQKIIKEALISKKFMMLSVDEKTGRVKPILLKKIKEDGDSIYFCLEDNEDQIVKVNVKRNGDSKNGKTKPANCEVISTGSLVLDVGSEMSVSVLEDTDTISSNNQSNLLNNDVEIFISENNTDVCTTGLSDLPIYISDADEATSVSISELQSSNSNVKKPATNSRRRGRPPTQRKQTAVGNIDVGNRVNNIDARKYPGLSVPSSKCDRTNAGVLTITKDILPKQSSIATDSSVGRRQQQMYKREMKQSEGYIPITSAILEKKSSTNCNKNKTMKLLNKERSLLSLLKMSESTTEKSGNVSNADNHVSLSSETAQDAVACSSMVTEDNAVVVSTERESQIESNPDKEADDRVLLKLILPNKPSTNSSSSTPDRSDTVDLDLLVGALNSKVSEKRNKSLGTMSPNEKKLKSSTSKLFRIVMEACKSDGKSAPSISNLIEWDSSEQCFSVNKNIKINGPVSLSKLSSDLSSLPVVSRDSAIGVCVEPVSSDAIENVISGEQFSNNKIDNPENVIGSDEDSNKAVSNDTVESVAYISNEIQCPGVGDSEPRNEISDIVELDESIQLGESRSTVADNISGEDVRPVSESKRSLKLPLLQQTMLKLVNEAESGPSSMITDHRIDESPINEELKLVSNIDSLHSFLESYGIHFTDDYI